MVRKVLSQYFDRQNRKYEQRGIEWVVHDNHYWLAIKIQKERADNWRRSVGYDPNAHDYDEEPERNEGPDDRVNDNGEGNGEDSRLVGRNGNL